MRTAILYNFLIEANIMASIAIVLMMVLRKCLRRTLGNSCICFGWVLIAARLLLPLSFANPIIYTIRSPFASDAAIRPIASQILVRTTDMVQIAQNAFERAGSSAGVDATKQILYSFQGGTIGMRLMNIYLLGAALITGWFIFTNVRFRLKLRAGRIEPISGKVLEEYQAMCRERNVKPVPVYYTDPLPSACLVGIFRPCIVLPLTAAPKDVINVLTHEICHLKNRDHLWALLRIVCCVLHWFNPLVWIAANMSRTDTELRCDDRVVAPMSQEQKQDYANVLVLASSRRNAPGVAVLATGMTMTGKRLKTRVMTVLQGAKPMRWLSIMFMVVASMCLVGAFATSETAETLGISGGYSESYVIDNLKGSMKIKGESDALDYAYSICDQIGIQYDGLTHKVERYDLGFNVRLFSDEKAVFYIYFDMSGIIHELYVYQPDMEWGKLDYERSIDDKLLSKTLNYTAAITEQLIPGLNSRIREWIYVASYTSEEGTFIRIEGENDYDLPVYVTIHVSTDGELHLLHIATEGNG